VFEIGATLREARERQGLELTQVERDLKIRARQLQALEEERFDWLPGEAYTRSFLRTYADYLGLEWQLYLAEYDSRFRRLDDDTPIVPNRRPTRTRPRRGGRRALAVAGVAAVAVVVGLAAWQLGGGKPPTVPVAAPAKPPAVQHRIVPKPGPRPVAHRVAAPKPKSKPAAAPKPRLTGEIVLTTANGPCWILVRRGSADGKQLYLGIVKPGKTISFRGKRLWVRLGAPAALRTVVNGKVLRLPSRGAPINLLLTPHGARLL
jgi:cytoskeleton protein RodZ